MKNTAIIDLITKLLAEKASDPGREPGVFSTAEYVQVSGIPSERALRDLKKLLTEGKVLPVKMQFADPWGVIRTVPGWKIVDAN